MVCPPPGRRNAGASTGEANGFYSRPRRARPDTVLTACLSQAGDKLVEALGAVEPFEVRLEHFGLFKRKR